MDCCPICDVELGISPTDKLRPDHNWQDIRAKIFPSKGKRTAAPEAMTSASPPAKRKERSLSSLVVSAPKVDMQSDFNVMGSKAIARKAAGLQGSSFTVDESHDRKQESMEDRIDSSGSSSSHETLSRVIQEKRQMKEGIFTSEPPNHENPEDDDEILEGKTDLWTPLNCLVEAANRTKSSKLSLQGLSLQAHADDIKPHSPETKTGENLPNIDNEISSSKGKSKGDGQSAEVQDDKNGSDSQAVAGRGQRLRAAARKAGAAVESSPSAKAVLDASGSNRRNTSVWFSLVASEDQKGDAALPQISAGYLRLKDGKIPASYIQKYLAKKLNLASESEVELMCRGQPVTPDQTLDSLVDLWSRTASASKRVPVQVGSSGKDFVMVLSYCRKVESPSNSKAE